MLRTNASLALVLLAGLLAWAPVSPAAIERYYSVGIYPVIQHLVTPLTNWVPFAVLDLLLAMVVTGVVWSTSRAVTRARRGRRSRALLVHGWHLATVAAGLYVCFLLLWGFNYRRESMWQRVELHPGPADRAAVTSLARQAVQQLNDLHARAHEEGWGRAEWRDGPLRSAFATTQQLLADGRPAEPGRLKRTVLGTYFRWSSVDGMVNPFGLEVLANPDLLPWERPFVAAHEWAHLAGYAHEAEANFVGWLTCVRADAPARYSGWLFLYWQIAGEVSAEDRDEVMKMLAAGPREDLAAIAERLRQGQFPLLQRFSWGVYDQYLKANRVPEGVRSYGEVLSLILRTRFTEGWIPVRRN